LYESYTLSLSVLSINFYLYSFGRRKLAKKSTLKMLLKWTTGINFTNINQKIVFDAVYEMSLWYNWTNIWRLVQKLPKSSVKFWCNRKTPFLPGRILIPSICLAPIFWWNWPLYFGMVWMWLPPGADPIKLFASLTNNLSAFCW